MTLMIGLYLFGLAGLLLLMMLWQRLRGTCELISVRNFAFLGLIVFQITSVGFRMFTGQFAPFVISQPGKMGLIFAIEVTIFVVILLLAYRYGWLVRRVAARAPRAPEAGSTGTLLTLSVLLTMIAVPLRFAVPIPAVGVVADMVGVGASAIACGLVGWVWAPRLLNPATIMMAGIILLANLFIVMTGEFGRRNLIAIFGCMIWGMYYSHWRYLPDRKLLTALAVMAAGPVIFLALYTSVRSSAEHDRTAGQQLQHITTGGNVKSGMMMLLDGQNTGTETLWLIENYPENFEPTPLMTITYFFEVNVPRLFWPDKPEPLSTKVATQARIRKVNRDRIKLSPGILGQIQADGGWYALILYALIGGLMLRFFDEMILVQASSPFVVLPIGSALGQILGLARGDTSTFANTYFITVFGTLLIMLMAGRVASRMSGASGVIDAAMDDGDLDETYDTPSPTGDAV